MSVNSHLVLVLVVIQNILSFSEGLAVSGYSENVSAEQITAIEQLLKQSLFKSGDVSGPALALSIVTKDNVLYEGAKGYKDLGLDLDDDLRPLKSNSSSTQRIEIEADMNTAFGIASVTKSFTATLAVKLLSEKFPELGESVLDTPIKKLVPDYNFLLSDRHRTETTTFRDLLAHRTCLKPDLLGQLTDIFDGFQDYVRRQRFSTEKCGMRSEFVYNNGLYALAGDIIAHIGNASYMHLMEKFFGQLGMLNSTFVKADDNLGKLPNRAKPYREIDGKILSFNPELLKIVVPGAPAGGIISSAKDMGKSMQFHLNEGTIGGNRIIKRDAMKWLVKPVIFVDHTSYKMKSSDINDFDFGYGLGFANGVHDGYQRISHAGSLPPYESFLSLYPDLDLGIFTVTSGPSNLAFGLGQPELHAKIVDIIKGISRMPNATLTFLNKKTEKMVETNKTTAENNTMESNRATGMTKLDVNLNALAGHYGSLVSGDLEITLKNRSTIDLPEMTTDEALWLSYGRWGKGWLIDASPRNGDIYKVQLDSDIKQILENSQIPDIMIEFQTKNKTLGLFFKGQKDQGATFFKGFNSTDFLAKNKAISPWDAKCRQLNDKLELLI